MKETFFITVLNKALDIVSKQRLRELITNLADGTFQINCSEVRVRNSRYRYYFGHVIPNAVAHFNSKNKYQILNTNTGEIEPLTIDTLHDYFKDKFNPVLVVLQGTTFLKAGSTTKLNDSEFINEYEVAIIEWLSNEGVFMFDREEWYDYMKGGHSSKSIISMCLEQTV